MSVESRAAYVSQWGRRMARWRGAGYHRLFPDSVGPDCRIGRGAFLDGLDRARLDAKVILSDGVGVIARAPGRVTIGSKTFVNAGTTFFSSGHSVTIGEDVLFGPHVTVVDQDHGFEDGSRPIARQGMRGGGPISIGDGAWVAAGAVLLGPTTLAPGCVVGANAVVKGHFPRRCVIVGAPARVVRYLDDQPSTDVKDGG